MIRSELKNLIVSLGQKYVSIGGVRFESYDQTIAWIRVRLPSGAHDVFYDVVAHLDALNYSHLSVQDFLREPYHSSRGKCDNDVATMITSSFDRELLLAFGKVDSITSSNSSSTHPIPQLKTYANFSSPDSQTVVKKRICNEMANATFFINDNITSRLSLPVASGLAHTFLIRSTQVINSLLIWMDNFYLEFQAVGQSSKDEAWYLVCTCIRCFFKELNKVQEPAHKVTISDNVVERAGIIL